MRLPLWLLSAVLALSLVLLPAAPAATARDAASQLRTVRVGKLTIGVPESWRSTVSSGLVPLVALPRVQTPGTVTAASVVAGRPRTQGSLAQWKASALATLRSARLIRGTPRSRIVRLPGGRAVEIAFSGKTGSVAFRALAYAFDGKPKAYVVVFMTGPATWPRYAPVFRSIARSVRIAR